MRSERIRPDHWERLAVVYVRQSTVQQVLHHQESTRLQYGLRDRATEMGWAPERVLVIDDDLGKSGASAEGRSGFQRLVSEVTLGHVGIILGIEMSRLARSCRDWHQLLEACGLFGCLIADLDGIYDPSQYNDRLLLGLKGTMSEAELHILKQRLHQGKLSKARRGELACPLPLGYVRKPSGEIVFDPDEQAEGVVRLVSRVFEERRTLNGTLRYLVDHGVQLGVRARHGPSKGELEWHRPNRMTLQNMLHNPFYAGVYAYGRRRTDARRKRASRPATGRVTTPREGWHAFLPGHHPAYISWERYEANLAQLEANRNVAPSSGAPREGAALLAGLLVCGRCGCRVSVSYGGGEGFHAYWCRQRQSNYGEISCLHVSGRSLDRFIETIALEALAPASLDLSLAAAGRVAGERERLERLWQQRLERCAYEVDLAARQYRHVEPENRLVARKLESDWEARLAQQRTLEEEHRRFQAAQPSPPTPLECEAIRRLAEDIPALWHAPTTRPSERKEILRQVIDRVILEVEGSSETVQLEVHWAGGTVTRHTTARPVAKLENLSYFDELCRRIREMAAEGRSASAIAEQLNAEGYRPPKRCEQFSQKAVRDLSLRLGLRSPRPPRGGRALGEGEWWMDDLARAVPMPSPTLYSWVRRGIVQARRIAGRPSRWILWADAEEVQRLRELRRLPAGHASRRRWVPDEEPPSRPAGA